METEFEPRLVGGSFFTYDNSLVQWWFHGMFVVGSSRNTVHYLNMTKLWVLHDYLIVNVKSTFFKPFSLITQCSFKCSLCLKIIKKMLIFSTRGYQWYFFSLHYFWSSSPVCAIWIRVLVYILSGTRPVDFFTRFVFAVNHNNCGRD